MYYALKWSRYVVVATSYHEEGCGKDWILKKQTKVYSRFLIEKNSEFFSILLSAFTLIMKIMISPKNSEEIAILKI